MKRGSRSSSEVDRPGFLSASSRVAMLERAGGVRVLTFVVRRSIAEVGEELSAFAGSIRRGVSNAAPLF